MLLLFGGYVLVDSLLKLVRLEHPPIGTVVVFGEQVWQGWLMLGACSASASACGSPTRPPAP